MPIAVIPAFLLGSTRLISQLINVGWFGLRLAEWIALMAYLGLHI